MTKEHFKKQLCVIVATLIVFLSLIYVGGIMGYKGRYSALQLSSPKTSTGILNEGTKLTQVFNVSEANLYRFSLNMAQGDRAVFSYAFTQQGVDLFGDNVDVSFEQIKDENMVELVKEPVAINDAYPMTLTIVIGAGNNAAFYYGDTYQLSRGEAAITDLTADTCLYVDDQQVYGRISADANSVTYMDIELPFLLIFLLILLLTLVWAISIYKKEERGIPSLSVRTIKAFNRYWFVMSQMISRDFKTKYKRSVLGVFWSFLNPLLTMGVQYVIFSTLFKSNIPYFPVYLMTGIVCFNFFSEGTNTGLSSITGNVSLLTKVYIPKYIFPISRVLSAGINFLFSLIPLLLIVIISGLPITRAYLLLPYAMICLLIFVTGIPNVGMCLCNRERIETEMNGIDLCGGVGGQRTGSAGAA